MLVAVVHVRKAGVVVGQWRVVMHMVVRLLSIPRLGVSVLDGGHHGGAGGHVFAGGRAHESAHGALSGAQPDAQRHEQASSPEQGRSGFLKHLNGNRQPTNGAAPK